MVPSLRMNCSVSLPAVPSPIAKVSISYLRTRSLITYSDCISLPGSCTKISAVSFRSPFSSITTILHPVRYPGSMARIRLDPNGELSSNCRRFSAKTMIASSSAFCLSEVRNSVSREGCNKRLYASRIAFFTCCPASLLPLMNLRSSFSIAVSSIGSMESLSTPSTNPRRIASVRWEGME